MEPQIMPTRKDKDVAIKEMELKVLSSFLSSDRQKTQITPDERILISVLDGMAKNPYPISKKICEKLGIEYRQEDFKLDFVQEFLKCFIEYGIPLGREGRKEEVKVLSSYFEAQRNEEKDENSQKMSSKLMK